MSCNAVEWSPVFESCYIENTGWILYSNESDFFFDNSEFPLLKFINKGLTKAEISQKAHTPIESAHFLYLYNQLSDAGIIVESRKKDDIVNDLCSVFDFLSPIKEHIEKHFDGTVHIVDFFNEQMFSRSIVKEKTVFIGLLSGKVIVTPVIDSDKLALVDFLKHSFFKNNPLKSLVIDFHPGNYQLPSVLNKSHYNTSTKQSHHILSSISEFLKNKKNALFSFDTSGKETIHSFDVLLKAFMFDFEGNKRIILNSCFSDYSKDGGYRSVSPSETLQAIEPLVDPLIGIVNDFSLISAPDEPVQIFRSAFYKRVHSNRSFNIDSLLQSCLGKGVFAEQSKVSAICESIERYSAHYQGNEPRIKSRASELPARYLNFNEITPYSDTQYNRFKNTDHPDYKTKQAATRYNNDIIHWTKAWSLSKKEFVFVPFSCCFTGIPFSDDKFGRWNSNGAAAGNTLEEAILQGLFELIERDAVAIWWYNKLKFPAYDLSNIDPKYYTPIKNSLSKEYEYWVLDLTIDTNIPVMAAIGKHKKNEGFIFGFGCHLNSDLAVQRALTELCQLIPIRDQNNAPFDFDLVADEDYLYPHKTGSNTKCEKYSSLDIKDGIEKMIDHLKVLDMEVIAFDYSRGFPVKTSKIFVPGLCHIWPQLGNERLYQLPVTLGVRDAALNEDTINQQALYL